MTITTTPAWFHKSPSVLYPLRFLNFINAHRDTWASNLFEQINWWFPLFDIEDENSLFFYILLFCTTGRNVLISDIAFFTSNFKSKLYNNSDFQYL